MLDKRQYYCQTNNRAFRHMVRVCSARHLLTTLWTYVYVCCSIRIA